MHKLFLTIGTNCSYMPVMSTFPILEKLGGREAVVDALAAAGMPTTKDQVRMWETRKRIPGDAQVGLMRLAEGAGLSVSSADFEAAAEAESEQPAPAQATP